MVIIIVHPNGLILGELQETHINESNFLYHGVAILKAVSQQIMKARSLEDLKKYVNEEWTPNWKSYDMLPEKEKKKDRIWANKVFDAIRSNPDVMKSILSRSARIY